MYAVIEDRGRQHRVAPGDKVTVDRLDSKPIGTSWDLPVLLIEDAGVTAIGAPYVAGAKATVKLVAHGLGEKGIAGTFRRRKHSRRRKGFRAQLSTLEIVAIAR